MDEILSVVAKWFHQEFCIRSSPVGNLVHNQGETWQYQFLPGDLFKNFIFCQKNQKF